MLYKQIIIVAFFVLIISAGATRAQDWHYLAVSKVKDTVFAQDPKLRPKNRIRIWLKFCHPDSSYLLRRTLVSSRNLMEYDLKEEKFRVLYESETFSDGTFVSNNFEEEPQSWDFIEPDSLAMLVWNYIENWLTSKPGTD